MLQHCSPVSRALAPSARQAVPRSAAPAEPRHASLERRSLLLSSFLALSLVPAARADTRLRGPENCQLGDEGRDCRLRELSDNKTLTYDKELTNGTTQGGNRGRLSSNGSATAGSPGADGVYAAKTAALLDEVERVLALPTEEPSRAASIQELRSASGAWVALYAPGGSSKRASGRAFTNALSQLQGHFSFNGLAPVPPATLSKVRRNLDTTREELANGR